MSLNSSNEVCEWTTPSAGASAISFHKMYPGTMMQFWKFDDGRPGEPLYRLYDRERSYDGWDAEKRPQAVDLWTV